MKVNIGKLLKHPKLFFLPSNVKIPVSIDIFKLHAFSKILLILSVSLRNERNNLVGNSTFWGEGEWSLNTFQCDHLLDLGRY